MNDRETNNLMRRLNSIFEMEVEIPRIKVGKKQTIETLINEEALLLAKFLRNESDTWSPRLQLTCSIENGRQCGYNLLGFRLRECMPKPNLK